MTARAVVCGGCGGSAEQILAVDAAPGPPDFDTRPSGPARATIGTWVARCRWCGYCSADLTHIHEGGTELVRSRAYQLVLADETLPEKAREFWCYSLVLENAGLLADAGWSSLHAAWVCDDAESDEAAVRCRLRAIDCWKRGKQTGQSFADDLPSEFALAADVYRRAGQFERAVITCSDALDAADMLPALEALLRREKTFSENRDRACHSSTEMR